MKELLKELSDTKLVRVTGSYADNTQTGFSDIDFYVKPNKPEQEYLERNMLKIIYILNKHNVKWASDVVGYIHTHNVDFSLPISIEFSDLFKHRKDRLESVNIMGIEFLTY